MKFSTDDTGREEVVVCALGQVAYEPAWRLQKCIQDALVAAKRSEPKCNIPHVMLLVEHPPVYTLGKSGDKQHLLVSEDELKQEGASFFHIDRGGDITFHGPGQLVGYPMLDLDRLSPDIHLYLRNLEETIMRTCGDFGVEAGRVDGKTGVWVEAGDVKQERKICAMGIRCSRWVTMHGFAFNLNTDVRFFDNIVPCGIENCSVTTLARELGQAVDASAVVEKMLGHVATVFDVKVRQLDVEASLSFLKSYLSDSLESFDLRLIPG